MLRLKTVTRSKLFSKLKSVLRVLYKKSFPLRDDLTGASLKRTDVAEQAINARSIDSIVINAQALGALRAPSIPDTFLNVHTAGDAIAFADGVVADEQGYVLLPPGNSLYMQSNGFGTVSVKRFGSAQAQSIWSLTDVWQTAYFHWIFEVLPKLILSLENKEADELIYVDSRLKFQREAIEALGVSRSQLIQADQVSYCRARRVKYFSRWDAFTDVPLWVPPLLRKVFVPDPCHRARRIYISRADARGRRVVNHQELETALTSLGFSTVVLSSYTFSAQIQLFASAQVVVAAHGAGLSNIAFCAPGTSVFELSAPGYHAACFKKISEANGLCYSEILPMSETVGDRQNWKVQYEDFVVDVARTVQTIRHQFVNMGN